MPDQLKTIRITSTTFDSDTFAPDGSHRFPEGLVVGVGEGTGKLTGATARRWVRAGFAEEYDGQPGEVVSNEEAAKTAGEIAAEIVRLQAQLARTAAREAGQVAGINRAAAPFAPSDAATGSPQASLDAAERARSAEAARGEPPADPYADPDAPDPWEGANLNDAQRDSLHAAGFRSLQQFRDAPEDDVLGIKHVGPATVARLRGGEEG